MDRMRRWNFWEKVLERGWLDWGNLDGLKGEKLKLGGPARFKERSLKRMETRKQEYRPPTPCLLRVWDQKVCD